MSRSQLLKYMKNVMFANIGKQFYAKSIDEAKAQFDALQKAQTTAALKRSLKKAKTKFTSELK